MKTKSKLLTALAMTLVLLLLAGFGACGAGTAAQTAAGTHSSGGTDTGAETSGGTETDVGSGTDAEESVTGITATSMLQGRKLGGVAGRMPESSARIFFQSMLGCRLASYTSYKSMDAALTALRSGWVDAVWVCDVSADYLMSLDSSLRLLSGDSLAAIEKTEDARFEFGMALKNCSEGEELRDRINEALAYLENSGRLQELRDTYISGAAEAEEYTEASMTLNLDAYKEAYRSESPIRIGVSGAVVPIELINAAGQPYGFCVALMDEIGLYLQRPVEFTVLDNETAFTSLMSGRIDAVFCYGSGRITTEGSKNWIMTDGYYPMQRYEFISY